jgi:hypothetical protein
LHSNCIRNRAWFFVAALCWAFAILFGSVAFALSPDTLPTGEFQDVQGEGGNLVISSDDKMKLVFRLVANGANGHSCGLEGSIEGTQGRTESLSDVGACIVDFETESNAIAVKVNGADGNFEACRAWCGMRASFDRAYIKVPAGCTVSERQARYSASKQAMDAKNYRLEVNELKRVQLDCYQYFERTERDNAHNDLALALHYLDKNRECLKELSETLASTAGSEAALRDNFSGEPMSFEAYLPTARTTWKVHRICSGARQKAS